MILIRLVFPPMGRDNPMISSRPCGCWPKRGYPGGAGFSVVPLWSASKADSTKTELAAYQRYLAEVGVQLEIRFVPDRPAYKAMLAQGKLPLFRLVWYADIPDPDNVLSPRCAPPAPPIARSTAIPAWMSCWSKPGRPSMKRSRCPSTARWSASSWTMPRG
jgi:ABC-type transport system substrate-binding protein